MRPLETRFESPRALADVTGVIVLSGSENVTLSQLYSEPQVGAEGDRLTTFLMLAERYPQARLVHTGNAAESPIARSLILGTGVDPTRIRFDDRATNTCDSARATQALVEPKAGEHWLLVTSAAHMPRAMACFRAVGWEVVPYPTDFRRGTESAGLGARRQSRGPRSRRARMARDSCTTDCAATRTKSFLAPSPL